MSRRGKILTPYSIRYRTCGYYFILIEVIKLFEEPNLFLTGWTARAMQLEVHEHGACIAGVQRSELKSHSLD